MGRHLAVRALTWSLMVALALWVLFLSGTYYGISHPVPKIGFDVLVGAAFAATFAVTVRKRLGSGRLFVPLVLVLMGHAAAAALAISPSQAWPRIGTAATLVMLYIVIRSAVGDPWLRRRLGRLVVAAVVAGASLYVLDAVFQWLTLVSVVGSITPLPSRPGGGALWFGSPQLAALFFALCGPSALAFAAPSTRRDRAMAALGSVLAVMAIVLSAARSVWLGCLVGVIVLGALEVRSLAARSRLRLARPRPLAIAGLAALGVAVVVFLPGILARATLSGIELRLPLWQTAIAAFASDPLTGIGPGNWALWNAGHLPPGVPNQHLPDAHDLYVEALAEFGIMGTAVTIPLGLGFLSILRDGRRSTDTETRRWATVAAVSVATFLGSQVTENSSNVPLALIAVTIPVAVLDARLPPDHADRSRRDPMVGGFLSRRSWVILAAVAIMALGLRLRADSLEWQVSTAARATAEGDWDRASAALTEAARIDEDSAIVRWGLALASARRQAIPDALQQLERVRGVDQHGQILINQAWLLLVAGREPEALAAARLALDRVGHPDVRWQLADGVVAFNVGVIAEQLADRTLATEAYARALVVDPSFAADSFWLDPARLVDRTAVLARASALARSSERLGPLVATDVWLEAGCARQAAAELDAARPGTDRAVRELVLEHAERPARLRQELERLARADPLSPGPVRWLAHLAALEGDGTSLARYRAWLSVLAPHNAALVGTVRGPVPAPAAQRSISSLDIVPVLLYQVESYAELLVPQAWTIGQRLPTTVVGPHGLEADCR